MTAPTRARPAAVRIASSVFDRPVDEAVRPFGPGQARHKGVGAGGEHQLVVRQFMAPRGAHELARAIDCDRLVAEPERNFVLIEKSGRKQEEDATHKDRGRRNGMLGQRFLEQLVSARTELRPRSPFLRRSAGAATIAFSCQLLPILLAFLPDFSISTKIALRLATRRGRNRSHAQGSCVRARHELPYDKLVLATGSTPLCRACPGRMAGLLRLRAIERPGGDSHRRGPVRGSRRHRGGLLGLEAAKALHDLGLETHVVEFAPRLMAVQLDDPGGRLLSA